MAALKCAIPFNGIATVTSADKTLIQIKAPTNQRLKILGFELGFSGQSTTDPPVIVKGTIQSGAGSGGTAVSGGSGINLVARSLSETPLATGLIGPATGAWGTDPAGGSDPILYEQQVHPQGNLPKTFYEGREIIVKGGERFALVLNSGSGAINTCRGVLYYEE